jgi:hypothetical protein
MMGQIVEFPNKAEEKISDIDLQYLELERQAKEIKEQKNAIAKSLEGRSKKCTNINVKS